MDASKYFAIRRIVTDATWKPVIAPMDCGQVVLENGDSTNAQAVRSDQDDSDTEKGLPASLELTIRATLGAPFLKGTTICYVKAVAGNGPVIASFVV